MVDVAKSPNGDGRQMLVCRAIGVPAGTRVKKVGRGSASPSSWPIHLEADGDRDDVVITPGDGRRGQQFLGGAVL